MSILSTNIAPADVHVTRGWKKELINYIGIAFGTMLYGLGYTVFMLSYHLTSGGIGGVSAIVYYATGFEPQITYGLINMVFLAVALKLLGWKFCVKTIWGVLMSTFWFWAWQRIIENPDGTLPMIVGNERFMAAIMGAMIEGVGMVFCFSNNGSTGGTDIVAACINKYKDMSLGTVILACDLVIISSCYFIFHDIQMVMFGYVLMAVCALTLDYVTRYVHQAVEFKIFSRNYEAIAESIHNAGFGVTVLDGTGWHTKTERKVVVCIASKRYSPVIARAVKRVDPYAFLSVTNTEGVYGEGFETMKTKVKDQKPIIVFATNNANKLREVRQILENKYEVRSLKEIGCTVDLPETSDNLKDNALQKAKFIKDFYGFDCFADDTGLEVEALNGKPGVFSARYATIAEDGWEATVNDHDSQANMNKLLTMLEGKDNRKAQFRTVIALIQGDNTYYFEGIVKGDITTERHGDEGFGYDPVFRPEGYDTTFAEMASEEKNKISHRGRAVQKLVEHLG